MEGFALNTDSILSVGVEVELILRREIDKYDEFKEKSI
jgi:hypothetical protein